MCLEEELSLTALTRPERETDLHVKTDGAAVQRLYETCRVAFSQAQIPVSKALHKVRFALDSIKPSDVGLDESIALQSSGGVGPLNTPKKCRAKKKNPSKSSQPYPCISYLHIYECKDFSMGIFCLPEGAVIPLHNHPNMTVLSKLLYGSMHVKGYDWANHRDVSHFRLAKLAVDRTMSAPCKSAVLYPTSGGNMHRFTAVTACAVLDVLAPPYSTEDGRHCTYYQETLHCQLQSDGENGHIGDTFVRLDEIQPPSDFLVKAAPYMGPRIVPSSEAQQLI